jgi:hypothetical protein
MASREEAQANPSVFTVWNKAINAVGIAQPSMNVFVLERFLITRLLYNAPSRDKL